MKKTGYIELFANIRKTIISFVSITMFVFLGMGVFLGMSWTGMAMKNSMEIAFKNGQAADIKVTLPYGIDYRQANSLLAYDGVDDVELEFIAYESFNYNDYLYQASITSYTRNINTLKVIEGTYPANDQEILIEKGSSKNTGIKIGDYITFSDGNGDSNYFLNTIKDYDENSFDDLLKELDNEHHNLKYETYKVVGIVEHPAYLSKSQSSYGVNDQGMQIHALFFLDYASFNEEVTANSYNVLLLKSDSLNDIVSYSDEFVQKNKELKKTVEEAITKINDDNYQLVRNNLDKFVDKAGQKLSDGQNDIDKATKEISDAQNKISKNEKSLADAKEKLNEAQTKLSSALKKLNDNQKKINEYQKNIDDNKAKLQDARDKVAAAKKDYDTFFAEYDNNLQALKDCLSKPYSYENIETIIEIINKFERGYTIDQIKDIFDEYDIEPSTQLQTDIDEFEEDLNEFKFNFMFDVVDEFVDDFADNSLVILLKEIKSDVDAGNITYREAVNRLETEYKNNNSLYKSALLEMYDSITSASLDDLAKYDEQLDDLSTRAKNIGAQTLAEADAYLTNYELYINGLQKQLDLSKAELSAGWAEYNDGYHEYLKGLEEYEDGKKKIYEANDKLADGIDDLEKAKTDLAKSNDKYADLLETSDSIKNHGVNIFTRNENAVVPYINLISDIIIKLKYSLGGLFLAISIMVCYSVVARNVNNQIREIGTKKALGLYDREITFSCLAYSFISIIIGTVFGLLLAIFVVERYIVPSVKGSFNFALYANYFDIKEFLLLFAGELLIMSMVTYLACRKILKENAVKLLQGKQPPENKNRFFEKFKFWQNMPLINKTIVNNCLSDLMRAFATVIGVAGCAALIVSSITLKDNVSKSFAMQYSDYFMFDSFVYFEKGNKEAQSEIEKYFDEHDIIYANTYRTLMHIELKDNPKIFGYAMVYEDSDSFRKLVKFDSVYDDFEYKGLWIPESYEKYHDLKAGEAVTISTISGESYKASIDGYYKYYSYMLQIYMDAETYTKITGEKYQPNIYLIDLNGNDYDTVYHDLKNVDGFTSMMDYYHYCKQDVDIFTSVSMAMVGIYLVVSILMAIFILLNLFETFIDEKKRELIVLMINGYSVKQANKYIYSDTIFLTVIGLIFGIAVGIFIGNLSVSSFEGESLYLIHQVDIFACIAGLTITSLLSFIMCRIALKRIKNFSLTDINKA